MVLVDTSVWIDFLSEGVSRESRLLADLIQSEQDIAVCGLIRQEVLQGIRDEFTVARIRNLLDRACYLSLEEPGSFDQAAEIYRNLRRCGKTIRSPADCLIASVAIEAGTPLLHRDRDFMTIAQTTNLKLYERKGTAF